MGPSFSPTRIKEGFIDLILVSFFTLAKNPSKYVNLSRIITFSAMIYIGFGVYSYTQTPEGMYRYSLSRKISRLTG